MSKTFDRVVVHVINSKRDVEKRLELHNHKCHVAIILATLEFAAWQFNEALKILETKR